LVKAKPGFKLVKFLFRKYEEIPEDWDVKKLGSLGEPIIGLTYEPKNVKSDGVLVLRAPNIQDSQLRFEDNVFVDVKINDKLKLKKGDLLICVRNGSKRLIGKCAYVDDNYKNMTFGTFMTVFRSSCNQYLFYQFQTPLIRKQITKSITFTINQITNQNLNSFLVFIPPINEQQKITSILSNVDNQIDSYNKSIKITKKQKTGLIQQLLTKGIGHKKFKKVKLYPRFLSEIIPEGWEIQPISKIADVIMGQSPPGESYNESRGIPLLNGPTEFGLIHPTPIQYTSHPTKLCKTNDILLCVRGSTTGRLNTADLEYCIGRGIGAIRGKLNHTDTKWLFFQFVRLQETILNFASGGGSTFPNINQDLIKKLILPYPKINEQEKIASILSGVDDKISYLESKKTKLESLKKGLMQKILTGKLQVKF